MTKAETEVSLSQGTWRTASTHREPEETRKDPAALESAERAHLSGSGLQTEERIDFLVLGHPPAVFC